MTKDGRVGREQTERGPTASADGKRVNRSDGKDECKTQDQSPQNTRRHFQLFTRRYGHEGVAMVIRGERGLA